MFILGYYAFMEASAPRVTGDKATIKSVIFPPTTGSGKCMSFWYHMFGNTIGQLKVWFRKLSNAKIISGELMWTLSGNQGDQWSQGRIPLVASTDYQVSCKLN